MARVLVCDPVQETRFLIERVVARMGHEIVGSDAHHVDVLFYEPASVAGAAQARSARRRWPGVLLVACTALPLRPTITGPTPHAVIRQPFVPDDVRRTLAATLLGLASR